MLLDQIKSRISGASYSELSLIAEQSGVPFHTLLKIQSGETQNPRANSLEALAKHFGAVVTFPDKTKAA